MVAGVTLDQTELDVGSLPPICTRRRPAIGRRNGACCDCNTVARAWVVHLDGGPLFGNSRAKVYRINPSFSKRVEATGTVNVAPPPDSPTH